MATRKQFALLFLFVFVDVLGFSLILPLLPYYAETFNATPTIVGLLLGANAVTQLISTPILGRLSDRYGRRPLLLLSIGGTVISFLLLALADSLWMLFFSRILDGLLGGNVSLAQAYIVDVTDEKNRARGLGLIGASFGLGFIFGPALGGALSVGGNYGRPAFVAAGLAALNLLGVLLWLPESLSPERREPRARSPQSEFSVRALWEALGRPCVGPLLVTQLLYALSFTTFETVFSLFAQKQLALEARTTGYVLTYVGVLVVLVQGGGIGLLTKQFSDKQLVFGGAVLATLSLIGWALTPSLGVLLAVLAPLALASGVLRVFINSALTKSVLPEEVGGALGLSASLGGLARVISPVVGGFLLDNLSPAAPGLVSGLLMAGVVYYTWQRVLSVSDVDCPEQSPGDLLPLTEG